MSPVVTGFVALSVYRLVTRLVALTDKDKLYSVALVAQSCSTVLRGCKIQLNTRNPQRWAQGVDHMAGVAGRSGLKPGMKHSGSFTKNDPRRFSAIKYAEGKSLMELARTKTLEAFNVICEVMEDPNAQRKERVLAAGIVLDRGWGRAVQAVAVAPTTENEARGTHSQIAARAERLLQRIEADVDADDDAVDAEYEEIRDA